MADEPEARVIAQVQAAIDVLEAADDQRGLSRAWRILTNVHFAGCRYLDATDAAERMIEHARRPATARWSCAPCPPS